MKHYLFITDAEGNEIAGSRRSIDGCAAAEDVARIDRELAAAIGDGCSVEDNVRNWQEFWADRDA